jgi:hypothetical protein
MRSSVIVDNIPESFGFQPFNGIPVNSWYDDKEDRELYKLAGFLKELANVDDVRRVLRKCVINYQIDFTDARKVARDAWRKKGMKTGKDSLQAILQKIESDKRRKAHSPKK